MVALCRSPNILSKTFEDTDFKNGQQRNNENTMSVLTLNMSKSQQRGGPWKWLEAKDKALADTEVGRLVCFAIIQTC